MLHFDFVWDLTPTMMIPDKELNTAQLKWKVGDRWEVVDHDGKLMFIKEQNNSKKAEKE
jgi:hypothetical protein